MYRMYDTMIIQAKQFNVQRERLSLVGFVRYESSDSPIYTEMYRGKVEVPFPPVKWSVSIS